MTFDEIEEQRDRTASLEYEDKSDRCEWELLDDEEDGLDPDRLEEIEAYSMVEGLA